MAQGPLGEGLPRKRGQSRAVGGRVPGVTGGRPLAAAVGLAHGLPRGFPGLWKDGLWNRARLCEVLMNRVCF